MNKVIGLTLCIRYLARLVKVAEEKTVDERRLAEAALPDHHEREVEPALHGFAVNLLRQRREPDVVAFAALSFCFRKQNT